MDDHKTTRNVHAEKDNLDDNRPCAEKGISFIAVSSEREAIAERFVVISCTTIALETNHSVMQTTKMNAVRTEQYDLLIRALLTIFARPKNR